MPREVVVFDTNAYRGIGMSTMPMIRAAERARGICAQASESVVLELLARYASDTHRKIAESSLRALVSHTVLWQFGSMIPFAQSPLRRSFLPTAHVIEAKMFAGRLSDLLVRAFVDDCDGHDGALQSAGERIREFVAASEANYGRHLFDAALGAIDLIAHEHPMLDTREARVAAVQVLRAFDPPFAAEMLALRDVDADDVGTTDLELPARTAAVLREAPVAVRFAQRQIERSAAGEIDPRAPKHANSLWDMELCALMIPDSHTRSARIFNQSPVVVVTSEVQIEQAAVDVDARHLMRTLGEHCAHIGLGALAVEKGWR